MSQRGDNEAWLLPGLRMQLANAARSCMAEQQNAVNNNA